MTPNNYQSPLTPFPLELKEDQLFNLNQASASSSSSPSCHSIFEPVQQQGGFYNRESHMLHPPEEAKMLFSQAGSCNHPGPAVIDESGSGFIKRNENQSEGSSVKWMSSKMRFMKKMMNCDIAANNSCMQKLEDHQKQPSSSSSLETEIRNNTDTIRVCADCNTTKTPLWRSGPRGPKSLCNACGIRQRKARRAMAAAAAAANVTEVQLAAEASSNKKSKMQHKDNASSNNISSCLPFKKRCKFTSNSPSHGKNKLFFEDLTIILSKKSSTLQRVFPQDEKEAAILLMALSHGLVHG